MADLSEYQAAVDRGMDAFCEEIEVPRAVIDAEVAAMRAAQAPRWAREAEMAADMQRRSVAIGEAWEEAFRFAIRESGRIA